MNSLVLKPCRWVAFFTVMPGVAPSSGRWGRTGILATGAPRRALAREACDALRRAPVVIFLVRRAAAVVFLDLWRVFPATELCVVLTSLADGSSGTPGKKRSQ